MKIKTVFATLATQTFTARAVKRQDLLVVTLGREASRIFMSPSTDARDFDALKYAIHDSCRQEANRRACGTVEVYVSANYGGHQVWCRPWQIGA